MDSMTGDTITLLRARGRRLAKLIRADGQIDDYDSARLFDIAEMPVPDLNMLSRVLSKLLARPDCAVVRGSAADPERVRNVRRLLHHDKKTGDIPTLRETARYWLALDIEAVAVPERIPAADVAGCAAEAIRRLPGAFHGARCIAQASGSHGIKPDIHLRLWYWLSRATSGAELKLWLSGTLVDMSVFGAAQLIYTAAPVFALGALDHLPDRIVELIGYPVVAVPAPDELKMAPRPAAPARPDLRQGSARADLYVRAALKSAADRIMGAGRRHPAILQEACGLARLVRAGLLGEAEMKSVLWQAAQAAGKDDEAEIDRIVKFGMDHPDGGALPEGIPHA
jgi:hypothetical protein